ncbi:hypothetical protein ASG59_07785 [Methylobacterium sp. Leaf466]|nr:hypothetical protein ASF39_15810 [Methylobacterium sp. Leaf108]KQT78562.1 hypothetical protein ASG59_07785 [Methylobacterium sp. Leaf466]
MLRNEYRVPGLARPEPAVSLLSEETRVRLGRELQALYEPIIDEPLDPRLAELMQQLEADKAR